ncbi:hypothetical protein A464_2889 [Salmonella bongori N268-08]|uniref:Uncharacterized protein n=1 Tax=Salmonella bongori N268-08 TaxID=1197719 RepID=S5MZQ2_SALBN|nr:hypothetical protein A464_2889 [Salmonella bongori N268-08]
MKTDYSLGNVFSSWAATAQADNVNFQLYVLKSCYVITYAMPLPK